MNQKSPFFFHLILCILSVALLCPLISCGTASPDAATPSSGRQGTDTSQTATGSILTDAYQVQISYYEEQLRELRDELIRMKEEEYIATAAYKEKISALEEELEA